MSLLGSQLAQGLFLQQLSPYTFTTAELDALKSKLQTAELHIKVQTAQNPKQLSALLQMSISEIQTLLRMIDMTYLQGLSATGGILPTPSTVLGGSNDMGNGNGNMNKNNGNNPPPNYVCHRCGIPGHYVQDCREKTHTKPPPQNYVCRKCNLSGHWIQECPIKPKADYNKPPPENYVCRRCNVRGHWIKNCPTNGNPAYDAQPGLKEALEQENLTVSAITDESEIPPTKKRRMNQM